MGADVFMKIICLRRINTDKDDKAIFAVSGWLRSNFFWCYFAYNWEK
jgi:hypothetical protein